MLWTETEIVNVRRFRQRDIMEFAEAVEQSQHIYDRRWVMLSPDEPLDCASQTVQRRVTNFANMGARLAAKEWRANEHSVRRFLPAACSQSYNSPPRGRRTSC